MTDITELKEKLMRYSRNNQSCSNNYNNIPWQYVNNMSFENVHSVGYHQGQKDKAEQDAKTITALLDIIEEQNLELKKLGQAMPPNAISMYCQRLLTATEQELKNLTEEK